MTENLSLATSVKAALTLGAAASLGTGVAFAQTAAPASSTAPNATNLTEITVTGSHIPQTEVAQAQPVVNISREQIENSGFSNLGEVLQSLPAEGNGFNNRSTNYIGPFNPSSGYFSLDLYNLGSQRVLVLVNGHRWIPTLSGTVNLSTIPTSIIDRIEVLLNGASAIYGSDAVSGVVNVITKKNYNGAEASAYLGEYDANGVGGGWDGRTQHYTGTLGFSTDRGSLVAAVSYLQQDAVYPTNRKNTQKPFYGQFPVSQVGSFYQPEGSALLLVGPDQCLATGVSQLCVSKPGYEGPFRPADRLNIERYVTPLTIPYEQWSAYVQGHYDFTSNISFHSNVVYYHRTSTNPGSPTPLVFGAAGAWSQQSPGQPRLPIGVSANNPYNPFGVDLIPASSYTTTGHGHGALSPLLAAWCHYYGSGGPLGGCGANSDLLIESLNLPAPYRRIDTVNEDDFLFRGGFTGYFQLAGNQWTWNAGYAFGRSRYHTNHSGIYDTQRLQQALGPNCDPAAGCVPLNIFNARGGFPKDQADYVLTTAQSEAGVTQRDYHADLAGNFWNGWYAGPWGVAAGLEYLETDGFFQPDGAISKGNLTSNAFDPTSGRVASDAEYAELNIPLARDLPGAKSLGLDLAGRWTQYHVTGQGQGNYTHAATPKVTFKYQPIKDLLFRGTWSQSFREPSISELFSGQSQSFNNYGDPCINKGGTPPAGTFNCPNPSPTAPYGQYQRLSGGNPQLNPEKATTHTAGFVWSPHFVPGFNVALDYYKEEVDGAVGLLSPGVVLNGCYYANIQSYCQLITRSGTHITKLNLRLINTGSVKTNGWIVKANYKLPSTSVGQFSLHYAANFIKTFVTCNTIINPDTKLPEGQCYESAGHPGVPKYKMTFGVNYSYGPWALAYSAHIFGPQWETCPTTGTVVQVAPSRPFCSNPDKIVRGPLEGGKPPSPDTGYKTRGQNHIGTTIYQDLQGSYTVNAWNTTFSLGVNNIFNKNSPIALNGLPFFYRIPGRFVYGRVTVRF